MDQRDIEGMSVLVPTGFTPWTAHLRAVSAAWKLIVLNWKMFRTEHDKVFDI